MFEKDKRQNYEGNNFFDQRSWESLNAYILEPCFRAKSNIRQFAVPLTDMVTTCSEGIWTDVCKFYLMSA